MRSFTEGGLAGCAVVGSTHVIKWAFEKCSRCGMQSSRSPEGIPLCDVHAEFFSLTKEIINVILKDENDREKAKEEIIDKFFRLKGGN